MLRWRCCGAGWTRPSVCWPRSPPRRESSRASGSTPRSGSRRSCALREGSATQRRRWSRPGRSSRWRRSARRWRLPPSALRPGDCANSRRPRNWRGSRSIGRRPRESRATSSRWRASSSGRVAPATPAPPPFACSRRPPPPSDPDRTQDKAAAYVTGLAALQEGKLDEARRELSRAVSLSGYEYAIYRLGLARAHRASGALAEALANAKAGAGPARPAGASTRSRGRPRPGLARGGRDPGEDGARQATPRPLPQVPRGLGPADPGLRGGHRGEAVSPRERGDRHLGILPTAAPAGRSRRVDHAVPVEVERGCRELLLLERLEPDDPFAGEQPVGLPPSRMWSASASRKSMMPSPFMSSRRSGAGPSTTKMRTVVTLAFNAVSIGRWRSRVRSASVDASTADLVRSSPEWIGSRLVDEQDRLEQAVRNVHLGRDARALEERHAVVDGPGHRVDESREISRHCRSGECQWSRPRLNSRPTPVSERMTRPGTAGDAPSSSGRPDRLPSCCSGVGQPWSPSRAVLTLRADQPVLPFAGSPGANSR